MSASSVAFGSLSLALAQTITYLTRSLIVRYSATTIIKLQLALEANLTAQFAPSWVPTEPLRGSGRRCLTLSPATLPPRPIFNACKSANVEWSDWIAALGGVEFDLFVDPGCVSVRFGDWDSSKVGKFFTIWSENAAAEAQTLPPAPAAVPKVVAKPAPLDSKTLAQQLLETDDDEDEQLFAMIADEMREPIWVTPIQTHFLAAPPRTPSPVSSVVSSHSRSSSSSWSSGSFSESSHRSVATVSVSSASSSPEQSPYKLSRRERARQARVFVDTTKKEVTNYDGGRTTVLTGGVMLGVANSAKPKSAHKKTVSSSSNNWRARA